MMIHPTTLFLACLSLSNAAQPKLTCDPTYVYRSANGSCNNLANPVYGMAQTVYQKLLDPAYSDGVQMFRLSVVNNTLPSARLVSTTVVANESQSDRAISLLTTLWSQFIEHDLSLPLKPTTKSGQPINCCTGKYYGGTPIKPPPSPECAPIIIPSNDPIYNPNGTPINTCMNYVRTQYQFQYLEGLNATSRQQINANTHWFDGSQIYGSTADVAMSLRNTTSGMGLLTTSKGSNGRILPPLKSPSSCPITSQCFAGGDPRITETPLLTMMYTLWIREHNRVATMISKMKPGKTDEFYYQEARRVVIAEMQHINYNEYLPVLIGEERTARILTAVPANGNYFNQVNPNVYNEWAVGAGLAYHSMMKGFLRLFESDLTSSKQSYFMRDAFYNVSKFLQPTFTDNALRGLLRTPIESVDSFLPDDVTSFYNRAWGQKLGLDLVALDIQAGLDHGVPAYLDASVRAQVNYLNGGNYFPISFDLLTPDISPEIIASLRSVYADPQDIDLFIGGISERPEPGSLLGPTFATIAAKEFDVLKHADRFFYNDPSQTVSLTANQISEIQKVSLSRIICDNSDGTVMTIQPNAFRPPSRWNKPVSCNNIPGINFANM